MFSCTPKYVHTPKVNDRGSNTFENRDGVVSDKNTYVFLTCGPLKAFTALGRQSKTPNALSMSTIARPVDMQTVK